MRTYIAQVALDSKDWNGNPNPTFRSTIGPVTREGLLNFLAASLVDIPHPKSGQVYRATVDYSTVDNPEKP